MSLAFLRQCALQAAAIFLAFCLAWPYYYLRAAEWSWPTVVAASGAFAFLFARLARQPWWRQLIHLLFVPALWAGLQLPIPPSWSLGAFVLLLLIFRGALSDRVPLYLSNRNAVLPLARLLPADAPVLDLGAGIASLLLPLARARPDLRLSGIDNAPLPWLLGWMRTRRRRIVWRWGDLWRHELSPYRAVYCFLSPAPMPRLWQKACREMAPGSLFVSKAFPVPEVMPERICRDERSERDVLYVYRIPDCH